MAKALSQAWCNFVVRRYSKYMPFAKSLEYVLDRIMMTVTYVPSRLGHSRV